MTLCAKFLVTLTTIVLTAGAADAANGVSITSQRSASGGSNKSTIHLAAGFARIDSERGRILFRQSEKTIRMVDLESGTYVQVDPARLQKVHDQVAEMQRMMQEKLKDVPPEQRAMMEGLMRQGMPGQAPGIPGMPAQPVKTEYRKSGAGKVGDWPCTRYEGFRGKTKVQELCAAEPSAIGVRQAERDTFIAMMTLFRDSQEKMGVPLAFDPEAMTAIPVQSKEFEGRSVTTNEVVDVSRRDFPDDFFDVPAGVKPGPEIGSRP